MTTSLTPSAGLDLFRQEAPGFDSPSSTRVADAVLTLLALRGGDRRTGLPEPTPDLVRQLLIHDVPVLVCATESELDLFPAVLSALADLVRAKGRLNAKRHARLLAAIEAAVPEFRREMAAPSRLTWPRWYASLMRADGTPVEDRDAVLAWLAAYDRTPRADRPALPAQLLPANVMEQTDMTRIAFTETLLRAFAADVEQPSPAGPLLPGLAQEATDLAADTHDDPTEGLIAELDRVAATLMDRWTAAGLSDALSGPYAHLAPGPESSPHLVLADALLDHHLSYYGDSTVPLPPPPSPPAPEELRGLLQRAPLPALLTAAVEDPGAATEDVRRLAVTCGLLQEGDNGGPTPGPAAEIWAEGGTPQDLVELAADILATVVGRLTDDPETAGEYADDADHLLYALYERGCAPESVARKAAEYGDWLIAPGVENRPVPVPDSVPAEYATPTPQELTALLGLPALSDEDRTALDAPARELAAVVDRLATTGAVFRTGDTFGLTPLGMVTIQYALRAGAVAAPDRETVTGWDAATLIEAARVWPPDSASRTLADWLAVRTEAAWDELLATLASARNAIEDLAPARLLFRCLDTAAAPVESLRGLLTDPVLGAYALEALCARGEQDEQHEQADADLVPLPARATLLLDDLDVCHREDRRAEFLDEEAPYPESGVVTAFDAAAATWPGGAGALIAALAEADAYRAHRVLDHLSARHGDPGVAALARRAAEAASPLSQLRKNRKKSKRKKPRR
ncbi:hypothetical protein ACIHCQ_26650 [Streptomyces sp. NPDC052236]|uniref:hypothetical protein n=1 Tax=Streptomyces sp. NPDC052236 TaxID=3365686 RepID=UPI0037D252B8